MNGASSTAEFYYYLYGGPGDGQEIFGFNPLDPSLNTPIDGYNPYPINACQVYTYTVPAKTPCQNYIFWQGCVEGRTCSGTIAVSGSSAITYVPNVMDYPTAAPTEVPVPTVAPTSSVIINLYYFFSSSFTIHLSLIIFLILF